MAATTTTSTVRLKLLIDRKAKRVVCAEAGKDFVDFLFNILLLPVATITRLLTKQNMVGCLGNLYQCRKSGRCLHSSHNRQGFGVSEGVAAVRCLPMCSFPMRRQIPRFPPSRQSNSRLKKVEAPVTVLRVLWPVEGRNGEQTNYVLHRNTLANIQLKTGSVQNFTICVFQTC
ncbi:hypothetical protein V6N13_121822 [Hibiscus sabdariffa]